MESGPTEFGTNSTLQIEIDVNDGGIAYFDYLTQAVDGSTFNISVFPEPPLVRQNVVIGFDPPRIGLPNPSRRFTIDLTPYRQQEVSIDFNTSYGFTIGALTFQARAIITDFQLSTCQVAPLTPLTDPVVIAFENGDQINTDAENFNLNTELNCLSNAVEDAGGTGFLTSAFRPAAYQTHLREVYTKQMLLKNRREPECETLKAEVQTETDRHGIIRRPARRSNHSSGDAFDFAITDLTSNEIDSIASDCGLTRPDPVGDRVHFSG